MGHFNKEEFGEKLRKARKMKGYSLDNLAYAINKNATTIGRYEKGEIMPDAETISLICEVLGISEYELSKVYPADIKCLLPTIEEIERQLK